MSQIKAPVALNENLMQTIETMIGQLDIKMTAAKTLADSILKLSDFYISYTGESTPWQNKWCQIGYLSYFLPLNFLRNLAVIEQGQALGFFQDIKTVLDFGSGLGAATLALRSQANTDHFIYDHHELSSSAVKIHKNILKNLSQEKKNNWVETVDKDYDLVCFSYSLTEINFQIPDWALNAKNLMIVEPSTQDEGRKLLELRQYLINQGFYIWAPCTHQLKCPLLTHSNKDWCHDRIHFDQPTWFQEIEKNLPIKNQTLTYSYLLASRRPPPDLNKKARIVGDLLKENGKSRQLICRGENREFLAWLHKNGPVEEHSRGVLINFDTNDYELRSNELRKRL